MSISTRERQAGVSERYPLWRGYGAKISACFMEARRELPDEALVPARLVLDDKAFDRIAEVLTRPPEPNQALRELMRGDDD